jgi:hypothetical protein
MIRAATPSTSDSTVSPCRSLRENYQFDQAQMRRGASTEREAKGRRNTSGQLRAHVELRPHGTGRTETCDGRTFFAVLVSASKFLDFNAGTVLSNTSPSSGGQISQSRKVGGGTASSPFRRVSGLTTLQRFQAGFAFCGSVGEGHIFEERESKGGWIRGRS